MKKEETSAAFPVETRIYPREAVLAAANTFVGKAFVKIAPGKKGCLSVTLRGKPGADLSGLEGEFYNELLHHALRLAVSERNQALREKIVAQALVSAQHAAPAQPAAVPAGNKAADAKLEKEIEKLLKEAEGGSYKKDPLGIAVPWEKKRGGKAGK